MTNASIDLYATFEATAMRYWLRDPDRELFIKGKGWTPCSKLAVGDVTVFGKITCIGTLEDLHRYWDGLDVPDEPS